MPEQLDQAKEPDVGGIEEVEGMSVYLPRRTKDYLDRDRLSLRFERFTAAY